MSEDVIGAHNGLHSEQGALPGEQRGRSANPVIKVQDVVWLEFQKPDLVKAEAFAHRSVSPQRCAPTTSCTCAVATPAHLAC